MAVKPGTIISAEVNVTTAPSGGSKKWESTAWEISGSPTSPLSDCSNTGDHLSSGTYIETFDITAPITPGTYTATFEAHDGDTCGSTQPSRLFALADAVIVDDTPPVITPTVTGTLGNNGWYLSAVTVSYVVTDDLSGVDEGASDYGDDVLATEGAGQSASATACDLAGNCAAVSVTGIDIDLTDPAISGSASPGANANGWNNSAVTVSYSVGDALSGVDDGASDYGDDVLAGEGAGQSATGSVCDMAGNCSDDTVSGIDIDPDRPHHLRQRLS